MKLIRIKTPKYLINLIAEFLNEKTFSVKVGDFTTRESAISCGVPQGAVMSPTLFSIYINDIPIRHNAKSGKFSLLYADDLVYLAKFKRKTKNLEKNTHAYLLELEQWSKKWRLKFAPHKCSYKILTRGTKNI